MSPLVLSFVVAGIGTAVATIAGVAIGVVLARSRGALADLADALVAAPMVLPPTVVGYFLLVGLGARSPVGRAYAAIVGHPLVFSTTAAILAAGLAGSPFVIKATRAALQGLDPRFVEVARSLGASRARALVAVELPLASRGIGVGVVLAFARALGEFGITLMVAGSLEGSTRTASLAIYEAIHASDDATAFRLAIVLAAIAIALLFGVNRLANRGRA